MNFLFEVYDIMNMVHKKLKNQTKGRTDNELLSKPGNQCTPYPSDTGMFGRRRGRILLVPYPEFA